MLLKQKRNLDEQLKKLKVKIKKLKRKGLGPAQEIMLETWTINTDKLKTEIEEITSRINEMNPEGCELKEAEKKQQADALVPWKQSHPAGSKKKPQVEPVMRS